MSTRKTNPINGIATGAPLWERDEHPIPVATKTIGSFFALALVAASLAHAEPGDFDPSFGTGGSVITPMEFGEAVAVQGDGKIVVGSGLDLDFGYLLAVARYTSAGTLDPSFGSGGVVTTQLGNGYKAYAVRVAIQSDGKIVVAALSTNDNDYDFAVVRYTSTGTLDPGFGPGGIVITDFGSDDLPAGLALQTDGKIVVAGTTGAVFSENFALVRYTSTGALDPGFGSGGKVITPVGSSYDIGQGVALQSDGKILVAGYAEIGNDIDFALVRYTSTGALDPSFGTGGKVITDLFGEPEYGSGVAVQSDGKILVTGSAWSGFDDDFALVRYTSTGALDPGFGDSGIVTTDIYFGSNDAATTLAVQSDGKIVLAGLSDNGSDNDFALARYTSIGELDESFGASGFVPGTVTTDFGGTHSIARGVALQSDGKIVAAGESDDHMVVARYIGSTNPADTDNDGLLDSWEITHFGSKEAHDADDDTDRDGRQELLELAFGRNPRVPDVAAFPQVVNEGGYLTITITKHPGVTYLGQSAASAGGAAFSATTTTVLINNATTLKVRDNFSLSGGGRRFLRLEVTAAP